MAASDLFNYTNIGSHIYMSNNPLLTLGNDYDSIDQLQLVIHSTFNDNTADRPSEIEGELLTYCFYDIPKKLKKKMNDWEVERITKMRLLLVMKKKFRQTNNYRLSRSI